MKTRLFAVLAVVCLAIFSWGCYHTVEGRTRMGWPMGKDKIESRYERSADQLFGAAKHVLGFLGTLTGENTIAKTLAAKIDTRSVEVKVEEVEPGITRVITQARKKNGFPDIELASEIDKQIALQLQAR